MLKKEGGKDGEGKKEKETFKKEDWKKESVLSSTAVCFSVKAHPNITKRCFISRMILFLSLSGSHKPREVVMKWTKVECVL